MTRGITWTHLHSVWNNSSPSNTSNWPVNFFAVSYNKPILAFPLKNFGRNVWFVHLHVLKMALDSCCSWTHNKEQKSKGGIFSFRSFHTSMKLPKHQSASFENRYLKLAFKWSSRLEDLNWIWTLSTIHQGYWVFCSHFQKLCKLGSFKSKIVSKTMPITPPGLSERNEKNWST